MILLVAFFIALILLIWFKTDAFVEYFTLLGFGNQIKSDEYENKKRLEEYQLTYPRFLRMKYDTFIIKIITCPICLSVWLTFIFGIFLVVSVIVLPTLCITSLIIYGVTCKLLGLK